MRKSYLILSLASLPFVAKAQNSVSYSYDAAGNRVRRESVVPAPRAKAMLQSLETRETSYSDVIGSHSVQIKQDDEKEVLKVSVLGLKSSDKCTFGVYTASGVQAILSDVKSESVEIDISSLPSGIYMMRVAINETSKTWKFVKK